MINYTFTSIEIETPRYKVIYGPTVTDENSGDWCMVIYKNGVEKARYSNETLLDLAQGARPVDLVLAGLVKHFM